MPWRHSWIRFGVLASLAAGPDAAGTAARATTLTVPAEAPTIQAALDASVDTVLVEPGTYLETPVVTRPVHLMAASLDPQVLPVLTGLALRVPPVIPSPPQFIFRGLAIAGPVVVTNNYRLCDIGFTACALGGGVVDSSLSVETGSIYFKRCDIRGSTWLKARGAVSVDSCEVYGEFISGGSGDQSLIVRDCVFQGDGTGHGLGVGGVGACLVERNVIRGYWVGGSFGAEVQAHVVNNVVEDCTSVGLSVGTARIVVSGNVIRRCGIGITVSSRDLATVRANSVSDVGGRGLYVFGEVVEVVGNIVAGCGGEGIKVVGSEGATVTVAENTSALNGDDGFAWDGEPSRRGEWKRNIGYANDGYGINWMTADLGAEVACNDWYANQGGAVAGQPPSSSDLAVEPVFCDTTEGDFSLNSASALVDWTGCGRIGALGVGCGETPTLVLRFTADRLKEGVRIIWRVADGASASEVWLERSEAGPAGGWVRPATEQSIEGGSMVELDREAVRGRAYWYRLVALEGHESVVIGQPVEVAAEAPLGFRIAEVGPNPGSGLVRIGFRLPDAARIEIEVFDIRGRRVASVGRGAWPGGAHEVEWDGRTQGGELVPAGLYVLRYAYPGGEDRRRLVRLP